MRSPFALLAGTAALLIAGCAAPTTVPEPAAPIEAPTEAAGAPTAAPDAAPIMPHWTYEGEAGPTHWGDLDAAFSACEYGKEQSPIDLASAKMEDLANIPLHYQASDVKILNNGHTVQVDYDPGSTLDLDGTTYNLAQLHFHVPSEHTVDGKPSAAEMHLVHKSAEGKLAVVGVMIDEGADNAAFKAFWDKLPAEESPETSLGVSFNANDVLPADQTTYRYPGSLTTPPCTEGVQWLVMTHPIEMSGAQIAALKAILHSGNSRPVQALGTRQLVEDSTP